MPDVAPAGFCDCHVHVVGPSKVFPQMSSRNYTAAPATLASLQAAAEPLGVTRFVVVQPSFYGSDNSCLLDALDRLGGRGRGVAATDADSASQGVLEEYERRGVRGVRVNLYSEIGAPAAGEAGDHLRRLMGRVPHKGWHVEIIAPLARLATLAPVLAGSPVPVVIDHYGLPGAASPEEREGRCLLELAGMPHVWVKLSAPYRMLPDPRATVPNAQWLAALLRAAPDRCLWGSDWPHTPPREERTGAGVEAPYRKLDYGRVLGDFLNALPEARMAESILVNNPERLYGFSR